MARRRTTRDTSLTVTDDEIDRGNDMAHAVGRIEGLLVSISGRIDRFEAQTTERLKNHEDTDTKRFDDIGTKHEIRFASIDKKLNDIIETQASRSGGWKVLTLIVTAAATFGGIIVEIIRWVTGH